MFIGIAATIPDLANLPGQGGESITVTLDYPSSNVCYDGTTSPSDASPAGGVFSYTGSGTLDLNTSNGDIDANSSDPGSYTVIYTKSGVSSNFPIVIGNDITLSITTVPGTTICTGDTATLTANASGGTGSFSYSWSTGGTGSSISVAPTTTTTYTVTVTDGNGCTATASQAITASTNATTIASIDNDYAMSFNGTDHYITAPNSSVFNLTNYSFSFWINNAINTGTQVQGLISCDSSSGVNGTRGWLLFQYGNELRLSSPGVVQSEVANFFATTNTWLHVGITYDGTTVKFYKNGSLSDTRTPSPALSLNSNGQDLIIGNNAFGLGRFFEGKLDEVAIFNSTLSSCDIKGIYEGSIGGNAGKAANLLDANTTIPAPVYWNRIGDS